MISPISHCFSLYFFTANRPISSSGAYFIKTYNWNITLTTSFVEKPWSKSAELKLFALPSFMKNLQPNTVFVLFMFSAPTGLSAVPEAILSIQYLLDQKMKNTISFVEKRRNQQTTFFFIPSYWMIICIFLQTSVRPQNDCKTNDHHYAS